MKGKPEIDQAPADQCQNHSRNKKRRDKNKKRRDKKNEGVKQKKKTTKPQENGYLHLLVCSCFLEESHHPKYFVSHCPTDPVALKK